MIVHGQSVMVRVVASVTAIWLVPIEINIGAVLLTSICFVIGGDLSGARAVGRIVAHSLGDIDGCLGGFDRVGCKRAGGIDGRWVCDVASGDRGNESGGSNCETHLG